ncbi:MAG: LuxR C-terminal-related transcriptional regulator [Proteobacteria bacterium]|nr:LuxR C-terminal-related transcriptional regulator [Pseudomonadota bacterium]MBU4131875.1 LuxR C-terminal-related transcriptional regulator [Pseudomonadota bacterium]
MYRPSHCGCPIYCFNYEERPRGVDKMIQTKSEPSLIDLLSKRELQVLKHLAQGCTNHEIADVYEISVKTVDTYRLRLLKKLTLRNNADLTRFAIQHQVWQTGAGV